MSLAGAAGRMRSEFIEELMRRGFVEARRPSPETTALYGEVEVLLDDDSVRDEGMVVEIGPDFPYRRPKVKVLGGAAGLTWHKDRDGYLCLWAEDNSVADLPWKYADVLLTRVRTWLRQSHDGWQTDLPVLDLERYFGPVPSRFLLPTGDLEVRTEKFFQLDEQKGPEGPTHFKMKRYVNSKPFSLRKGQAHGKGGTYGATVDVGQLDRPFGSWADFESLVPPEFAKALRTSVELGKVRVVVVQYSRGSQVGQCAFLVKAQNGIVEIIGAMDTVPTSQAVRRLRAGHGNGDLAGKAIAVIGVGAVGSQVVDLLLRRGVGKITIMDGDFMRPGNSVRHLLATTNHELSQKVLALREHTDAYGFIPEASVSAVPCHLRSIQDAEELLREHDLVVDATASGECSSLLADAASEGTAPVVMVALQRDGGIIRVDTFPGDGHFDPVPERSSAPEILTEAGCADPISPVSPDAVVEAAVWAGRVSVDRLLADDRFGPSVIVVTEEQPDPPFDRLGVIVR